MYWKLKYNLWEIIEPCLWHNAKILLDSTLEWQKHTSSDFLFKSTPMALGPNCNNKIYAQSCIRAYKTA